MDSSKTKKKDSGGFTLTELLIVSPLVIIVVAVLISFIIILIGDTLVSRQRAVLAYNTTSALDRIEQDIFIGSSFVDNTGTMPDHQGSNAASGTNFNGTSAFNNPATTLIISQYATTQNPFGAVRNPVYYANTPNSCASAQVSSNDTLRTTIIYYRDDDKLYRRTSLPTPSASAICAKPWQRNSCRIGLDLSTICRADDELIARNISNFSVQYYATPSSSAQASSPLRPTRTAYVTISSSSSVAGTSLSFTGNLRASLTE